MYYNIELAWEPQIIGVKNGVYQVELDKRSYDKKTFAKIESLFINNEFTVNQMYPDLDFSFNFKKLKSAKKTTFMSFSPYLNHCHFLVHKNILDLLLKFNIQKYKTFKSVIYDSPTENLDNNYELFNLVLNNWNLIDFDNTVFTSGGFGNNPKIEHKFSDENELKTFKGIARVKTLAMSKDFDTTLDLFLTRLGGLFVSEKLKLVLEENNATGIKFNNEIKVVNIN